MNAARKPRIFLSRASKGLTSLASVVEATLQQRGFEVVHQPSFEVSWRKIRHFIMDRIRECDCVLCLIGPAFGSRPHAPIRELADPRTGRTAFSYAQIELLLARRLNKPVFTMLLDNGFPVDLFEQSAEERELQSSFIHEYILVDEHLHYRYRGEEDLLAAVRAADFPLTTSSLPAASPENIPFKSIGTLLTGRAEALQVVRQNFMLGARSNPRGTCVQVVHGLGGVGKTRLAVEFAYAHAADYSARFFLRGSDSDALRASLTQLCGFFYLNLEEQDETDDDIRIEAVLRWLRARPGYLLVIDNADGRDARDAILQLVQRVHHGHVLITSRLQTWSGDIARVPLEELSDADAATLLRKYRASPKAPCDSDPADLLSLARDLGGLPLAIEQAAAFLNVSAHTAAEYHALWKSNVEQIQSSHDPVQMTYDVGVAATWLTTFNKLAPSTQSLLSLLSWFAPDPIPRTILDSIATAKSPLEALAGTDPRDALGALVDFSLAKNASGNTVVVHRLVQQVTRERQPRSPAPPALLTALALVDNVFDGHSDEVRAWPKLVPLVPHAISVAKFGDDRGVYDPSARILSLTAVLLHAKSHYRTAKPLYRRALALDRNSYGPQDLRVASSLLGLAQLLVDTNHPRKAEPLMWRALEISEQHFSPEHPKVALCLNNLAQLLAQTERRVEAELMMRRALAIDETWFGAKHPNVARDLNNLGELLMQTERLAEAEPMMWRALAIDEVSYGAEHPTVARDLNNLAQLLVRTEQYDPAEPLMLRALAIDEASFGKAHPNVARDLNNLAQLLLISNRAREAEGLMRRALHIDETALGDEHPVVSTDLTNLGLFLAAVERTGEAEQVLRRALKLDTARFGNKHPVTASAMRNLAQVLAQTGRHKEAAALLRQALQIYQRFSEPDDRTLAATLCELAAALQASKRLREAESALRKAVLILEKRFDPKDRNLAEPLYNLALLLHEAGHPAEAEGLMRRAMAIDEQCLLHDHPRVVLDLKGLALLLETRGGEALDEAEACLRRALSVDIQRFGSDHPEVALDLDRLARLTRARVESEGSAQRTT